MTFNNAPWAVDGARTTSALARQAVYSSGAKNSGIVKPGDLKVSPLAVPGNGLRIASGAASVVNWYQTSPNEAYTASNPSIHTVLAADMPAPVPSLSYYLVCVVVGDPEFDQTGHPFMPSDVPPEDAADFEYVRIVVVPCSSTTTKFEQLGLHYPAYALARLAIPASTTTITSGMITDLREIAQPRTDRQVLYGNPAIGIYGTEFEEWHQFPSFAPTVHIPEWATHATIVTSINSFVAWGAWYGQVRTTFGGVAGTSVVQDTPITSTDDAYRFNVQFVWIADVSAWAGLDKQLTTEVIKTPPADGGNALVRVESMESTQVVFDIQFSEKAK